MTPQKKKPMTTDQLAEMVAGGFAEVGRKFNEVDKRFNQMDARFDAMDKRFDKIENILLASHQNQIDQLRDTVLKLAAFVNMPRERETKK